MYHCKSVGNDWKRQQLLEIYQIQYIISEIGFKMANIQKDLQSESKITKNLILSLKTNSQKQKQKLPTISRRKKSNSTYETLKNSKKMCYSQFIYNTKFLLENTHIYGHIDYIPRALETIQKNRNKYQKDVIERLNFLMYMEETVKYKSYPEIQAEIIKEWKKNGILTCLQLVWMGCLLKGNFKTKEEFQMEISLQKNFIGQLAFNIFQPYFSILVMKNFPILDRLIYQTSTYIISNFSNWKDVYEKVIVKMYTYKEQQINFTFNLNSLNFNNNVIDSKRSNQYTKTIQVIKNLIEQVKLIQKIKLLQKMRQTIQLEIQQYQTTLIQKGIIDNYKIVEKDEIIDILIYCIVNGEIQNTSLGIKYFQIMLGEEASSIISRWKADSYRADLQSAIAYLLQNSDNSILIKGYTQDK